MIAIRVCSGKKRYGEKGFLYEIYEPCVMLKAFFRRCRTLKIKYGVLSRKFGIILENPNYPGYPDEDCLTDQNLLKKLKKQAKIIDEALVYWNHRPLTHKKWVSMLREAGFEVNEVRTLRELEDQFMEGLDEYLV